MMRTGRARGRAVTALAALLATAVGCERNPPEMSFLPEDRAEIETLIEDAEAHFREGDWEGAAARFHPSAILLRPGHPPVEERERIRTGIDPGPTAGILELHTEVDEIEGGPFLAYGRGTYRALVEGREEGVGEELGVWLAVFRRDDDDRWSIHRLMWNPHPEA